MHIQEEQYRWEKMIEAERAKGRAFVHDLAMQTIVDLRLYGITTLWMAEQFWMNDMTARLLQSIPNSFVNLDGSFIDYFNPKETA